MGTMGTMRTLRNPTARGGGLRDDQTPAFGRSVADGSHADTHRHPPTPTDTHRHPPTPTDTHQHAARVSSTTTAGHECKSADSRFGQATPSTEAAGSGCCGRIGSCVESRQLKSSRPPSIKYTFKEVVCNPLQVRYHGLKCRSLGVKVSIIGSLAAGFCLVVGGQFGGASAFARSYT